MIVFSDGSTAQPSFSDDEENDIENYISILRRKTHKQEREQDFKVDDAVKREETAAQQNSRAIGHFGSRSLKNDFGFPYLGTAFGVDTDQKHDINLWISKSMMQY